MMHRIQYLFVYRERKGGQERNVIAFFCYIFRRVLDSLSCQKKRQNRADRINQSIGQYSERKTFLRICFPVSVKPAQTEKEICDAECEQCVGDHAQYPSHSVGFGIQSHKTDHGSMCHRIGGEANCGDHIVGDKNINIPPDTGKIRRNPEQEHQRDRGRDYHMNVPGPRFPETAFGAINDPAHQKIREPIEYFGNSKQHADGGQPQI